MTPTYSGHTRLNLFYVSPITGDLVYDEIMYNFHVLMFKLFGDRLGYMYTDGPESIP